MNLRKILNENVGEVKEDPKDQIIDTLEKEDDDIHKEHEYNPRVATKGGGSLLYKQLAKRIRENAQDIENSLKQNNHGAAVHYINNVLSMAKLLKDTAEQLDNLSLKQAKKLEELPEEPSGEKLGDDSFPQSEDDDIF
jgi:uncharacterized hydantoinase/oxoprolinase family protein